jgi:hypothetical protein
MLGEIARWHKRDLTEQALYQVRVLETRRQLRELQRQKAAKVGAANAVSNQTWEIRLMPVLQPHPEALAGVAEQEIITVVSGLPRSGTSLMMQILEAAGLPVFTDNKRPNQTSQTGEATTNTRKSPVYFRTETDLGPERQKAALSKSSPHFWLICRRKFGGGARIRNRSTTGFSLWSAI